MRFFSYVLLCLSHLVRASGDGQETTQQHDSVVQGPLCHHRAQGGSVNPFGYPPLSDVQPLFVVLTDMVNGSDDGPPFS